MRVIKLKYLAVAAVAAAVCFAYFRPASAGPATSRPAVSSVTVGTSVAFLSRELQSLVLSGKVVPQDALRIGTELGAVKVARIFVDVGQEVKKGQVLARLDTRLLSNSLQSATAEQERTRANIKVMVQQLASAKAQASEAKAALARAEQVAGTGAMSREAIAQRKTTAETTAATAVAAEAQLEAATASAKSAGAAATDARTRLDFATVTAPADGTVSARNIAAGEVISSANNPLFVVNSNVQEIEVELSATQREVLPQLTRASIPGHDTALSLRWTSPEVYASGNTARARFNVSGEETLTPGTRVMVELVLAEREAIRLPRRAVQKTEKGWSVFVVQQGKAVAKTVTVQEPMFGKTVTLEAGVLVGEHVIVDGTDFVYDGMAVTEAAQVTK